MAQRARIEEYLIELIRSDREPEALCRADGPERALSIFAVFFSFVNHSSQAVDLPIGGADWERERGEGLALPIDNGPCLRFNFEFFIWYIDPLSGVMSSNRIESSGLAYVCM